MRWGKTDLLVGVPAGWQNKPWHRFRSATLTPQGDGAVYRNKAHAKAVHEKGLKALKRRLDEDEALEREALEARRRRERIRSQRQKSSARIFFEDVSGKRR